MTTSSNAFVPVQYKIRQVTLTEVVNRDDLEACDIVKHIQRDGEDIIDAYLRYCNEIFRRSNTGSLL